MKPAAAGIRMHSGWGALVVLSRQASGIELLERRRITVAAQEMPGAKQPYHFVEKLPIAEAEKCLAEFTTASEQLAGQAVGEVMQQAQTRGYRIVSAAILLASARTLPPLPKILSSHALIHTAEGEFFRTIAWQACDRMHIPVVGFRERDLEEQAQQLLGSSFALASRKLSAVGKAAGPPWTLDHKNAAWAALLSLAR